MLQSRFSCVAALRGYIIWCLNHILNPFQATAMRIKQCWPTTISSTSSSSQWLSVYDRNFSRHKPLSFPKGRSNPKCQTKALGRGDSRRKQRLATFIKRRLANASITDAALFISYETAALETRTVVFPHSSPHLFSRPERGGGRDGGGGWKGGGGGGKGRGGENRMIRDHRQSIKEDVRRRFVKINSHGIIDHPSGRRRQYRHCSREKALATWALLKPDRTFKASSAASAT